MSHYTIDYSKSLNAAEQAVSDIVHYLGQERFDHISDALVLAIRDGATVDDLRLPLSFAGVTGYPVVAWYDLLKGRQIIENK